MYNVLEGSDNYTMTSGSLWNHRRDEVNYDVDETNANNGKTITSKSFE